MLNISLGKLTENNVQPILAISHKTGSSDSLDSMTICLVPLLSSTINTRVQIAIREKPTKMKYINKKRIKVEKKHTPMWTDSVKWIKINNN